jgi:hypothetical protein
MITYNIALQPISFIESMNDWFIQRSILPLIISARSRMNLRKSIKKMTEWPSFHQQNNFGNAKLWDGSFADTIQCLAFFENMQFFSAAFKVHDKEDDMLMW